MLDRYDDDSAWAPLRAEVPLCTRLRYLNTGTAGPVPRLSERAYDEEAALERAEGRGNFATFGRYLERAARLRSLVGGLIGADASEVALTHHTSDGCNIVLWGLDWKRGDVIVTTSLEHDAVTVPLGLLRERFGVEVRFVDVGRGEDVVAALRPALSGAKLCVVSHVVYTTGALVAVEELGREAHAAGAELLVDGAQSAGVLPVDVGALGVDYYTVSGQKWLCGPEGTGALYVRRDRQAALRPTFASYFSAAEHDWRGHNRLHDDARRYEVGMFHRPSLAAFEASLRWLTYDVGIAAAWARSRHLATLARSALSALPGVSILTPEACPSQLLSFTQDGFTPERIRQAALALARAGVVIRSIDHEPHALRAAFGFFNDRSDVQALVEAVAALS